MSKLKQYFSKYLLKQGAVLLSACLLWSTTPVVLADGGIVTAPPPVTGIVSANFVEDRENISVIEFVGDYNMNLVGGQLNTEARAEVAKAFYKDHPDNYDFLVVFSTFEFDTGEAVAFHVGLQNDVQGIGLPTYNYSSQFGSNGKLKGYIDMAAMSRYNFDPLHPNFDWVLGVMSHEVLHQWGSRVKFKDEAGNVSDALIGKDGAHWSYLLDSDASVEYGSKWRDNTDGTFTSVATRKFYSPLDLYLMGMYGADEVPPFTLIENPSIDKTQLPQENITIEGTKRTVTIEEIIAAEGPRIPAADSAQKNFRLGVVLLTGSGETIPDATITQINHVRNAFMTRFAILTGGRGIAEIYPEALPIDSVTPPSTLVGGDLRNTATSLDDAITWLRSKQDILGYWNDKETTRLRDTAVSLNTLLSVDQGFSGTFSAVDWLGQQESTNTDYISRQLILLGASSTTNIQALTTRLLENQNSDGGWGLTKGFESDALDTALAIQALLKTGAAQTAVDRAVSYLIQSQNADGGWSNAKEQPSRTSVTATVLNALKIAQQEQQVAETAFAWLNSKQNIDGGFGDSPSTVYDTANALNAYILFDRVTDVDGEAAAGYLLAQQTVEGSFNGSTYNTALAIETLKRFSFANWVVDSNISFSPQTPSDGSRVKLDITITNDSNIFTPEGVLRVYDGDPSAGGIASGSDVVIPAIGPNAGVTISYYWDSFDKPGAHTFYAVVDPDSTYSEMSEKDNQASVQVTVEAAPTGIELSVVVPDLAAVPAKPNRIPTNMGIAADVRNFGLTDAANVRVVLWKGGVGVGTIVEETTVNIPNRSSVVTNFTNVLDAAGTTLYSVHVDPDNLISESRKDNNSADIEVTTDPSVDFAVDASDISSDKSPAILGDDINFKVILHNYGTLDSPSTEVTYVVTNGIETRQLGTNALQLASGESTEQNIVWRVDLSGDLIFTASIDDTNLITEIDDTNNKAILSLVSQTANGPNLIVSYKDLKFNPLPGNEGYPIDLSMTVRNNGNVTANDVEVAFYDGEPSLGGILLGTQVIATLDANSSAVVTQNWSAIPTSSSKLIYVVVDPNNTIVEFSEADNSVFELLSVLSLPDFAISESNITITPAFPVPNDDIQIKATIANIGQQSAANVIVRAFYGDPASGGTLIGEQTIPQLVGSNATSLTFNYNLTSSDAQQSIVIQVDPESLILERYRDNNSSTKMFAVQDGNAYVSEKLISPNGDGIKDTTEFFFRTASITNVTVNVLNKKDKIVRTFRNDKLNNITQGNVAWDGLDDLGRVVEDSEYTIQLLDGAGQSLASVAVVTDTNRSSLLKAFGTKYELYTNMTCELPTVNDLSIANNEQDVTFRIYTGVSPDVAYPKGIYRMAANGTDVRVVVPESWLNTIPAELQSFDLKVDTALPRYLTTSNDGSTFIFERFDRRIANNTGFYSWYVADKNGKSIRRLPVGDYYDAVISPDGKKLYRRTSDDIVIVNTETLVEQTVPNTDHYDLVSYSLSLSPDGKHLAYRYNGYDDSSEALVILNTETGAFKLVNDNYNRYRINDIVWSPDSKKFVEPYYPNGVYDLRVYSANGDLLDSFAIPSDLDFNNWSAPSWNSSGSEFAIRLTARENYGGGYGYGTSTGSSTINNGGIYVASIVENTFTKVADLEGCSWCDSSESYHVSTWDGSNWIERGELHYRRFLREKTLDLSKFLPDPDGEFKVRIRQVGKEAAHVESVSLLSDSNRLIPSKATKLEKTLLNQVISLVSDKARGIDVLEAVRFPDNEVLDLYEQEMEVQWLDVAKGQKILLALNAREEELSKLNTLPFSYPVNEGESYKHQITENDPLVFDAQLTSADNFNKPLFKQFTRPDTGHPPGTVYGYAKSDKDYLYGALDFTVDNTMDDELDWASMIVKTSNGWKEHKVNLKDNTHGKVLFGKTQNVPYTHKYYEFRIPLSDLGLKVGDIAEITFKAYGTAAIVVGDATETLLPRDGNVHWDPASQSLLYDAHNEGRWAIFLDDDNRLEPIFSDWSSNLYQLEFISSGRKLIYQSDRDRYNPNSLCADKGRDTFSFASLQNLTVDLRATRSDREGGIILRGTAADLYFDRYQLDYADVNAADVWNPVAPSSSVETIDDRFTTWVPPGIGNYFVRLTAYDKAGNSKSSIKRVSWGNTTSISNLYRTPEFISPNGDGTQDSMALHYRVLEPVHLEFNIYNETDDLVRSIARDHSLIGTEFDLIWDGRDNTGLVVADGRYKITVQNYEFFVIVDNTAPVTTLILNNAAQIEDVNYPLDKHKIHVVKPSIDWSVDEKYQVLITVEYGDGAEPIVWNHFKTIDSKTSDIMSLKIPEFTNHNFRFVVSDKAGNVSVTSTGLGAEEIVFTGRTKDYPKKFELLSDISVSAGETIRKSISQLFIEYKEYADTTWIVKDITDTSITNGLFSTSFRPTNVDYNKKYDVRIKALDSIGATYYSEIRKFVYPNRSELITKYKFDGVNPTTTLSASANFNGLDLNLVYQYGLAEPLPPAVRIKITELKTFIKSSTDKRFLVETQLKDFGGGYDAPSPIKIDLHKEEALTGCTEYQLISRVKFDRINLTNPTSPKVGHYSYYTIQNIKTPCMDVVPDLAYPPGLGGDPKPRPGDLPSDSRSDSATFELKYNNSEETAKGTVTFTATENCGDIPEQAVSIALTPFTRDALGLKLLTVANVDPITGAGLEDIVFNVNKPTSGKKYTHNIDTSTFDEGVRSFHINLINNVNQEWQGDLNYIVDHTPPTLDITYPIEGQAVCGTPRLNEQGGYDNFLPVEVILDDPATPGIENVERIKDFLTSSLSIANGNPVDGELLYSSLRKVSNFDEITESLLRLNNADRQEGTYHELKNLHGEYTLKFTGSDLGGFKQCTTRTFTIDGRIDATTPTLDLKLFSPNADGNLDDVTINYSVAESVVVNVDVYAGTINSTTGKFVRDATPIRNLSNNQQLLSGDHQLIWDGKNDTGTVVADGNYVVVINYKDGCGNLARYQTSIMTVDNLAPTVSIDSPNSADTLAMVVEILASVDDLHFKNYIVTYGVGSAPEQWISLGSGTRPLVQELAASWNTIGLVGDYSLRLAANDHAGNMSEVILPLNIVARTDLLSYVEAVPRLFSPNNDDVRETSTIRIGLLTNVSLTTTVKDETGGIVRTLSLNQTAAEGAINLVWDGTSDGGIDLPDATYTVFVNAVSVTNSAISQDETVSIILDRTAPVITITRPESGFASGTGSVIGTIEDAHIISYTLSLTDTPATPVWNEIGAGNTNQYDAVLGSLEDLAEGEYALKVIATDEGEIVSEKVIPFEVDSTPPIVEILSPENNDFIGLGKAPLNITAKVDDKNIQLYTLSIGEGDTPSAWSELVNGSANVLNAAITTFDVGSYADGLYTLRLTASDKANNSAETSIVVTIDNTPPTSVITVPIAESYIKGPVDINGTATDLNFVDYTLSIAPGTVETANQWSELSNTTTAVDAARLLDWQLLPADGLYTLRLLVKDKADNVSEVKVQVNVDQTPPAAPTGLVPAIEDKVNVRLTWNANSEPDLAGYAVYRDGARITTTLLATPEYLDVNVDEGRHEYTVTAFDFAAWESEKSNLVEVTIDTTPPITDIHLPTEGKLVSGLVDVRGTAHSVDDFKEYRLYVGFGETPSTWQLLRQSPVPTLADTLSEWNTVILTEGAVYTLKLESEDLTGNVGTDLVTVTIDNLPPAAPTGLVAVDNGSDVNLTWNVNDEPDLLGYLVFRDERIANSTGVVVGDLKPYAVVNTAYPDLSLPDGPYIYTIVAIDLAGNTSDPSLPSEVLIDTRPPHAVIQTPDDGHLFEQPLYINAVSEDSDIAEVQFQYRAVGETVWINLDVADTSDPFEVLLDPTALGISYGSYQLQAVATDLGAKVDPAPTPITVTYKDLTRPDMTLGLANLVNAGDVSLIWTANTDADLAGYHLERADGLEGQADFVRITTALLTSNSHVDTALADSNYRYRIIAVDTSDNEADPSAESAAIVYTPTLAQPYTPVNGVGPITILGQGIGLATAGGTVTNSLGVTNLANIDTDDLGNFILNNLTLDEGDNTYTIQLTDAVGNISKSATVMVQSGTPPSQPTGLLANNIDFDVSLSWNTNPETNIAGYRVFRNGDNILPETQITGLTATSLFRNSYAQYTVNGTTGTNWPRWDLYKYNPQTVADEWLEVALPARDFIARVQLYWYNSDYRAVDFDLQFNSKGNWVTVAEIRNNPPGGNVTEIDINSDFPTDKLRVVFLKANYKNNSYEQISLTEILLFREVLQVTPNFVETAPDGNHSYTVSAVNTYGFESIPSDPATLPIGDITAPDAVTLTVDAIASDANLSWTASASTDVAKYEIYRDTVLISTHADLSNLTYVDAGLKNGTYTYLIKVVDNVGNLSAPSNEAQAVINVTVPVAPVSLTIVAPAEGEILDLAWQPASGSTPSGYNVLRSLVSNGPYDVVATNTTEITLRDSGLTNGTTYYYVVLALDALGNVSVNSNEANGTPLDTLAADVSLFYPTQPGNILITSDGSTSVAGTSEPSASVDIYKDGNLLTNVIASTTIIADKVDIQSSGWTRWLSPDGKQVAWYESNGNNYDLRVKNISANESRVLTSFDANEDAIEWLPNSSALIYQSYNRSNGGVNLHLYDLETDNDTALGLDTGVPDTLNRFTVSPDGNKLITYGRHDSSTGLWLLDLNSKVWTDLGALNNYPYQYTWSWSPDSTKVAFIYYSSGYKLFVADTESLAISAGFTVSSRYQISWSPDGTTIAYSNNGIYLYDVATNTSTRITAIANGIDPKWSQDPNRLFYITSGRIYEYDFIREETKEIYYAQNGIDSRRFQSSRSGYLGINSWPNFERITPTGHFIVENIELNPGDNIFTATATDASDNTSAMSDAIVVNLNLGDRPDLVVDGTSIKYLPNFPLENSQARISVTVRNDGSVTAPASSLALIAIDAEGNNVTLLDGNNLSSIQAGSSQTLKADWTVGLAGLHSLVAVVDSENDIEEVSEANNFALKEVRVNATSLPEVTISTDKTAYGTDENALIDIAVHNSGSDFNGRVDIVIEDAAGYQVVSLSSNSVVGLAYADVFQLSETWNTGSTYAGNYIAKAKLIDTAGLQIAEASSAFNISVVAGLTSSVITDSASYNGNSNVKVTGSIDYSSGNSIFSNGVATLRIVDGNANLMAEVTRQLGDMLPGNKVSLSLDWNTGLSAIGDYFVTLDVVREQQIVTNSSTQFIVESGAPDLAGVLSLSAQAPAVGDNQTVTYTITNNGNAPLVQLPTRVIFVDPSLQSLINTYATNHDFAVGGSATGSTVFATIGLSLKEYNVVLQVNVDETGTAANWVTLQSASFPLLDRTPPLVEIQQPLANSFIRGDARAIIYAVDALSSVKAVNVSVDNSAWSSALINDAAKGLYGSVLQTLSEGPHTLKAQAFDAWNNVAVTPLINFTVDNTAPVITITGVTDAANYNAAVTPVITVEELNLKETFITLNGLPYVSGAELVVEGPYTLVVRATDLAGNSAQTELSFLIDTTPPEVIVTGVDNDAFYNTEVIPVITISDTNLVSQDISLNGQVYVSGTPVNLEDVYQLIATATDISGNTTTVAVNFEIDITPPVIDVTGVINNTIYNVDVTPVISVTDTNLNSQTTLLNTQAYVSGTVVTLEGNYQLSITADDKAGNVSSLVVNFELDKTIPSIVVTGVEDGGLYNTEVTPVITVTDKNIKSQGASLNGQPFTSGTSLITEGLHQLAVVAEDIPGNQSSLNLYFEIDTTPPVVTITTPLAGEKLDTTMTDVIGTTEALSTVFITVGSYTSSTIADANGLFSFLQVPLAEGENTIAAYARDRANNTGPTETVTVTVVLDNGELYSDIHPASGVLVWAPVKEDDCSKEAHYGHDEHSDDHDSDNKDDKHDDDEDNNKYNNKYSKSSSSNVHDKHSDDSKDDDDNHDKDGEHKSDCHTHQSNDYAGHTSDRVIDYVGKTLDSSINDYLLVHSEAQFITALRSQRYGTMLLLEMHKGRSCDSDDDEKHDDNKHNYKSSSDDERESKCDDDEHHETSQLKISEKARHEIRAMAASGTGFVWIKTHPDNNEHWQDILGAKHKGVVTKVTGVELTTSLASQEGVWASSGKATRVEVTTGTAIGKLQPSDKPAMVLNTYAQGAVLLINFDPSLITNVTAAQGILVDALNYASSTNTQLLPGGLTEINWLAKKVEKGTDVRFDERLAEGMIFVNALEGTILSTKIEASWLRTYNNDEEYFKALVQLPAIKGIYTINGKLFRMESSFAFDLVDAELELSLSKDRSDYGLSLIESLSNISVPSKDEDEIDEALEHVQKALSMSTATVKEIEESIYHLVEAEEELADVNADMSQIEAQLGNLLRTYQILWTELKQGS